MVPDRVSQRDIAERLGLSVATVSRSLRNDRSIHPATRARVQELAIRLGYRLPPGRTATREDGLSTLLVLLGPPVGPSRAGDVILAGISEAAASYEVQVAIHVVASETVGELVDPQAQPAVLRAGKVGGLLLVHRLPDRVVTALSARCPTVSILHHYPELAVDCVDTDQIEATAQMVELLHARGHRHIGFVGRARGMLRERRRFCGYREGLHRVALPFDPQLALQVDDEPLPAETAVRVVHEHAAAGVRAWVCASDGVAQDLQRRLRERDAALSGAVALTGYGGLNATAGPDAPRLAATVRVPYRDLGAAALRRLLRRLDDPTSPLRDVLLRHELCES